MSYEFLVFSFGVRYTHNFLTPSPWGGGKAPFCDCVKHDVSHKERVWGKERKTVSVANTETKNSKLKTQPLPICIAA